MTRPLTLVLSVALLVFQAEAHAQWWLFPGSEARRDSSFQKNEKNDKPVIPDNPLSSQENVTGVFDDIQDEDKADTIKIALLLPIRSDLTPNVNFLDFYCGVLMAVQESALPECKIELTVKDCAADGFFTSGLEEIKDIPLIIGPVDKNDLVKSASMLPESWFISPLEPKAEELVRDFKVIQTPTPYALQRDNLVRWIKSDIRNGDRVVLLQNAGALSSAESELVSRLDELGIEFELSNSPESCPAQYGSTTRFILVTDDCNYAADKVREIALMTLMNEDVVLYSTSKIRNVSSIEAGNLYLANAHVTLNYHADAMSEDVNGFIAGYKERFLSTPGMFAFHGYDVARYFISMFKTFGEHWADNLSAMQWSGIQSDFRFNSVEGNSGMLNSAIRKVVYNRDRTITLEK